MYEGQARHTPSRFAGLGFEPAGRPLRRGRWVIVHEWERGLLFRYGRLDTVLAPGRHRRWGKGFSLRSVDTRPWIVGVPIQEVPTADGATVKLTVAGQARVTDAAVYAAAVRNTEQALYLAVQVALRELLAATTVEDLLTGRSGLGGRLLAGLRGVEALGITVEQLEIKDIILSGELKKAQTEVLVARAQGLAALERGAWGNRRAARIGERGADGSRQPDTAPATPAPATGSVNRSHSNDRYASARRSSDSRREAVGTGEADQPRAVLTQSGPRRLLSWSSR